MVQKQFDSSHAIKCCLVGDGFVGKSYLASAFLRRTLPKCYKATLFEHLAGIYYYYYVIIIIIIIIISDLE